MSEMEKSATATPPQSHGPPLDQGESVDVLSELTPTTTTSSTGRMNGIGGIEHEREHHSRQAHWQPPFSTRTISVYGRIIPVTLEHDQQCKKVRATCRGQTSKWWRCKYSGAEAESYAIHQLREPLWWELAKERQDTAEGIERWWLPDRTPYEAFRNGGANFVEKTVSDLYMPVFMRAGAVVVRRVRTLKGWRWFRGDRKVGTLQEALR